MNVFNLSATIPRRLILLCVALSCAGPAAVRSTAAQDSIPDGTILPVRLSTSLSSRKSIAGQAIVGRIMQDVPLGAGVVIHRGARVTGHVVSVTRAAAGRPAEISFQFDALHIRDSTLPVITDLRAVASPLEIDGAQLSMNGGDRGTPPTAYTTVQVGGDVVYRGGGPVMQGERVVGEPVAGGVLVTVRATEGMPCRGSLDGNALPQAMWLFSSDACGVYGYSQMAIAHAGRTKPLGQIVLASTEARDLSIRAGSGMLLRVDAR
ncbi:MAG: hypothetical protein WCA00_10405 [Candidatus Acidiferrales bacterium]